MKKSTPLFLCNFIQWYLNATKTNLNYKIHIKSLKNRHILMKWYLVTCAMATRYYQNISYLYNENCNKTDYFLAN